MNMMYLSSEIYEEIIKQAEEGYPNEICGIISTKSGKVGDVLYKMKNISDHPRDGFFMDPAEQLKIIKQMRNNGETMCCIYHSHPDVGAYISKTDDEMAYYRDVFYLVISVKGGKVDYSKAFYYENDEPKEVKLKLVKAPKTGK